MSTLALSLFGGLMAIPPLLILYARQARPYAITLCLALIAIWAVYKWMERPRLSYATIYSVSGVLAVYCHVIVAPVVFGVWVWFLLERIQERRGDWPNTLKQLMLGVLTLGITALLVAPPLASDLISLTSKGGGDLRSSLDSCLRSRFWRYW